MLAAALAETGRFAEAAATAKEALDLAVSPAKTGLIEPLRARMELYQAGSPFRDTQSAGIRGPGDLTCSRTTRRTPRFPAKHHHGEDGDTKGRVSRMPAVGPPMCHPPMTLKGWYTGLSPACGRTAMVVYYKVCRTWHAVEHRNGKGPNYERISLSCYLVTKVTCGCGSSFVTRSTVPEMKVDTARLPSVLYWQAEVRGYGRSDPEVPEEVRRHRVPQPDPGQEEDRIKPAVDEE